MEPLFIAAFVVFAILIWLRVRGIEAQADRDSRYFEWWMRSMENRKQDREWLEPVEDDESGQEIP